MKFPIKKGLSPKGTLSVIGLSLLVLLMVGVLFAAGCSSTASPTPSASPAPVTSVAPSPTPTPTPTVAAPPPKPANPTLIMASTTSTHDSGLMDVLQPMFEQQTGYSLKPVYVGSGQAIANAQQGQADFLLVHSPAAELKFVVDGWGINRKLVMHNDFIIVGPPSDPAGIKGMTSATDALKKISDAKINFYSRGDNSGTDVLEKGLWAKIGITVKDGASTNPSWYLEANLGMGDLLRIVSDKQAYTISDRATFYNNQKTLQLNIMVQGDPTLLNVYHVIEVNPDKFPNVTINTVGAKAFSAWILSPPIQAVIGQYGVAQYGQPLFFPDAGKTEASLGSQ